MEMSGQLQAPAALPPVSSWIGGWVVPRVSQDVVKRKKFPEYMQVYPKYRWHLAHDPFSFENVCFVCFEGHFFDF